MNTWIYTMHNELGPVEKEIYELIKGAGEVVISQIPREKGGAIPNLVNKGLLEVVKRNLSPWNNKKIKLVKVVYDNEKSE